MTGEVTFFADSREWRNWLSRSHASASELWVGFRKKGSGAPSITWPQAVDEALCFGWIDGVRKNIDATSYKIRFTPRKSGSIWSAINIRRVKELTSAGLMRLAGLRAFEHRSQAKSKVYSYEQKKNAELDPKYAEQLKANRVAWAFFQSTPPSYQRAAIWWVISAKQEATRLRRMATLVEDSAHGRTIAPLTRKSG